MKYAATADDAFTHAQNILGLDIKGHIVKKLLVSEASDIAEEYYLSFLLDRANRTYLAMCLVEGGMEIEEVAATKPERLAKVPVDAVDGVDLAFARSIAEQGHLPAEVLDAAAVTIETLWKLSVARAPPWSRSTRWCGHPTTRSSRSTATSPWTPTPTSGSRGTCDPGPRRRHPLELKAKEHDLNYVKLDGQVGSSGTPPGGDVDAGRGGLRRESTRGKRPASSTWRGASPR